MLLFHSLYHYSYEKAPFVVDYIGDFVTVNFVSHCNKDREIFGEWKQPNIYKISFGTNIFYLNFIIYFEIYYYYFNLCIV